MQMNENTGLSLNPAESQFPDPETRQDTTDPEDEVSYASISFTRTNRKVQVQGHDEGDEMTYSSVKTASYTAINLNQFSFPQ
ncbi:hypothetical protein Q5P01_004666 [Channa striata]|uniref:Uncharacterized protein n=1 Tax=Channa striata TaxID=64152 RepID=A0AA88NHN3_CHASR|nr:hypothetical protein Q5P01_004666 [Channa striata]